MAERFDIVVAGAGHNSLIAAAYLAKAGYRCVVLEGRPIVGGGVKSAHLTLPGFVHDVCSSAHNGIHGNPILRDDELKLGDYGLEYIYPDPVYHMPFPDGSYLTQWRDLDRTCEEFAKFSKKDAAAYRKMLAEFDVVKPILLGASFTPIGFGKPLNDQLARQPRGKLWQRRLAMSAWEIIRDTFEEEHCRTFLLYMSHLASEPPDAPMTGRLAYGAARQQHPGRPIPKGGSGALTQALARSIEAHGGVLLTNKWAKRLVVENGRCNGVECSECMACHVTIAKNKASIQKLAAFSKSKQSIPWVRVYTVLPGVTWNHRAHLEAGVKCETCHGQVAQLEAMAEVTSVTTMYSCLNCHEMNHAKTACDTCHKN